MHRRTIESIAATINNRIVYYRGGGNVDPVTRTTALIVTETLANDVAKTLKDLEPSLDTNKFLKACGVGG